MSTQPYIFKKQIIAIICLVWLQLILYFFKVGQSYYTVTLWYLFVILGFTFVPSLRKNIKYSKYLHSFIYYFPMYASAIKITRWHSEVNLHLFLYLIGMILVSFIISFNKKEYLNAINGFSSQLPITPSQFRFETFSGILGIISEELFFRGLIISCLENELGSWTIVLSAFLFSATHFLNRWANVKFKRWNYISIFCLGLVLGAVYYITHSLIATIFMHLLYNSSFYINLIKRLRCKEKISQKSLFDDY